jgi:ribosomal protein L33
MNIIQYDSWCVYDGNLKRKLPCHEERGIFFQSTLNHENKFDVSTQKKFKPKIAKIIREIWNMSRKEIEI